MMLQDRSSYRETGMDATMVEKGIRTAGIIAIVRGGYPLARMLEIGDSLAAGGLRAMEVTLNSPAALEAIPALLDRLGSGMLVGAGTVRSAGDVEAAVNAGARFLVSPNLDRDSVVRAQVAGVLHLPGVFTPGEAQAAFAAGCPLVKLFPAEMLGPAYLRSIRAPLDDIGFVPTGGVDAETIGDWVTAGAVAFGVGSALVRGEDPVGSGLEGRARRLVTVLQEARARHGHDA